jgi:hypothetical protein
LTFDMRIVLVLLGSISAITGQAPIFPPQDLPPTKSTMKDTERAIVVEGCIRGDRLKIDRDVSSLTVRLLDVTEFVLQGPKETLQRVKTDHDGHQDEISGIVVVPAGQPEKEVVTKEIGKRTRVTAGASTSTSDPGQPVSGFKPMRLKLGTLRHLSNKCSIPG